ncbi:probable apyrase 6 isoform X1 [Eucalyptus grandis]|uniref:probable apyrase 6 isoform X1 n=2 Tax=Eucalyptus grandis TaxID=71139 RepID=UPI00192E7A60|nr:probable apyrase 6 isoform X1 [Eucalyptus grandis]
MRRSNARKAGSNRKSSSAAAAADDDDHRDRRRSSAKGDGDDGRDMDPIKFHLRPSSRSTNLFSRNPKHPPRSNLCLLSSALVALALLLCYAFLSPRGFSILARRKYAIVIDGGSTGTRIHVFSYGIWSGSNAAFDFGENGLASLRVNPGLSAYAEDPEEAGASLAELLGFAKRKVPREFWGETEVRLMATAGMRMLERRVQDQILDSCRKVLRASGFQFQDEWASVITGSDEGVYAWVVANYALGALGGDPRHTTGIIELGGASAQVTFSSSAPLPPEFSRTVKFGNITYNLYSHSFLQFGQNVAFESLKELLLSEEKNLADESHQMGMLVDPCTPKGYSHAEQLKLTPGAVDEKERLLSTFDSKGNFSECRSAAFKLLQKEKDKCAYRQCYIGSTFTPKLQGRFLATENFFHTSKFFGLTQKAVLSDLMLAGEHFCGEDWSILKKRHHLLNEEDLLRYCFSSAYIVAFLHDSLGIALNDDRIAFSNQVGSVPLDWALGAFILQATGATDVEQPSWPFTVVNNHSPILLSLLAILIISMFISWIISKWRKPQVKIIYDLEKGRYTVTRVNRS